MTNLSSINHSNFDKLINITNNPNKAIFLDKLIFWWQISTYTLDDGKIWFTRSIPQIAEESKLSIRTVGRYLSEYESLGLIERVNKLRSKKRLYIRITEKLLQHIQKNCSIPMNNNVNNQVSNTTKTHDSVFLNQTGIIDNANLAVSIYKEKDFNYQVNNTVSVGTIVDKQPSTSTIQSIYPTYKIESVIGERIDELTKNYIKGMMFNLQKQHKLQFSSPEELFAEIVFSVLNKEQMPGIENLQHKIQIIAKLLREKRWLTPKGFYNHCDYGQQFRKKSHKNDIQNIKSSQTNPSQNKIVLEQQIKKHKSDLNTLIVEINSETRFLEQETSNFEQYGLGSQSWLDKQALKLAGLYEQASKLKDNIAKLELEANANFIEHTHQDITAEHQLLSDLEQDVEELEKLSYTIFDKFCTASKANPSNTKENDALYAYYERIQSQLSVKKQQAWDLEVKLYRNRAA